MSTEIGSDNKYLPQISRRGFLAGATTLLAAAGIRSLDVYKAEASLSFSDIFANLSEPESQALARQIFVTPGPEAFYANGLPTRLFSLIRPYDYVPYTPSASPVLNIADADQEGRFGKFHAAPKIPLKMVQGYSVYGKDNWIINGQIGNVIKNGVVYENNGGVVYTNDGGKTWQTVPAPYYVPNINYSGDLFYNARFNTQYSLYIGGYWGSDGSTSNLFIQDSGFQNGLLSPKLTWVKGSEVSLRLLPSKLSDIANKNALIYQIVEDPSNDFGNSLISQRLNLDTGILSDRKLIQIGYSFSELIDSRVDANGKEYLLIKNGDNGYSWLDPTQSEARINIKPQANWIREDPSLIRFLNTMAVLADINQDIYLTGSYYYKDQQTTGMYVVKIPANIDPIKNPELIELLYKSKTANYSTSIALLPLPGNLRSVVVGTANGGELAINLTTKDALWVNKDLSLTSVTPTHQVFIPAAESKHSQ